MPNKDTYDAMERVARAAMNLADIYPRRAEVMKQVKALDEQVKSMEAAIRNIIAAHGLPHELQFVHFKTGAQFILKLKDDGTMIIAKKESEKH